MPLDAHEFIRRFLLHVIPKGFVRVRHFGFLANRSKGVLVKCRQLLDLNPALPKLPSKSVHELMLQLTGIDITRCPSMPKGNSGLFCQPTCPRTMAFFVMIEQPTKNRVLVLLCARAHASIRLVSLPHVLLWRFATRLQPIGASKTARCSHDQPCLSP
jgi:hypothetical protein